MRRPPRKRLTTPELSHFLEVYRRTQTWGLAARKVPGCLRDRSEKGRTRPRLPRPEDLCSRSSFNRLAAGGLVHRGRAVSSARRVALIGAPGYVAAVIHAQYHIPGP